MKNFTLHNSYWLIIILVFVIVACDTSTIYRKDESIEDKTWNYNKIIKFNVPINDTTEKYNFFINIRNSADYSFMNLFVFMTTLYPDGNLSKDTIEFILARPNGKWLGKGRNIIDNKILLKQNMTFKLAGTYSFEFMQAMRVNELKGIEDFGIQIETVK